MSETGTQGIFSLSSGDPRVVGTELDFFTFHLALGGVLESDDFLITFCLEWFIRSFFFLMLEGSEPVTLSAEEPPAVLSDTLP